MKYALLLVVLLSIGCAANPFAPSDDFRIVLVVTTAADRNVPITGATIRVTVDGRTRTIKTNAVGRATVDMSGDTPISIIVIKPGFASYADTLTFDPHLPGLQGQDYNLWSIALQRLT